MSDTTSTSLTIKNVPKANQNDPQKVDLNGNTYKFQDLQQLLQQAASAPVGVEFTAVLPAIVDPAPQS